MVTVCINNNMKCYDESEWYKHSELIAGCSLQILSRTNALSGHRVNFKYEVASLITLKFSAA